MEERARIPVGPPVTNPLPSYWHNPKSPLANVIEAEPDAAKHVYDYAIIGSGISGTSIAYNLLQARPDVRIVMLEAREACGGATGRNGGHTKAASYRTYLQHCEELDKEEAIKIARFEHANIVATHKIAKELEIECESKLCNTVDLIYDQGTFERGKEAIEAIQRNSNDEEKNEGGVAWYKIHTPHDASQNFFAAQENANPTIKANEQLVGAFEYLAGRINAYRFSTGLLNKCTRKGLRLCTSTPVHAIRPAPKSQDEEASWEVFTQYSTIRTRSVVLATNGYTPYILPALQGAIVPLRGQITAQRPGKATTLPSPLATTYSFIYESGYEYTIPYPLPDGSQHIVIGGGFGRLPGGGASEFGTVDDSILNKGVSKYLHESLAAYFGADNWGEQGDEDKESRIVQEWTGIMGATADGRPYVGAVPGMDGVWISAGFNGHGMVLCLKAAQALAEIIGGKDVDDVEWFPTSFLISKERIERAKFQGRTDMYVPETGERAVAG